MEDIIHEAHEYDLRICQTKRNQYVGSVPGTYGRHYS